MLDKEMIDMILKLDAQLVLDQLAGDNREVTKDLQKAMATYAKDTWPAQFKRGDN
jgi:hypothetical protein